MSNEDTEARFRKMILSQTPGKRVAMACGMFSTGEALVRAGLNGQSHNDELSLRQRLFLRLYGDDFSPSERTAILKKLETL